MVSTRMLKVWVKRRIAHDRYWWQSTIQTLRLYFSLECRELLSFPSGGVSLTMLPLYADKNVMDIVIEEDDK